jgi:hypothetical protein
LGRSEGWSLCVLSMQQNALVLAHVPHSSVYCLLFMFIVLFILSQSSTSLSHPLFLISSLSLLSYQPSLISSLFLTLFNQLRNSQEGVVDRTLIANLLVSYFAKKRYRVMRLCRLWTTHCCSLPTRISFIVVVKILFFLASFHTTRLPLLSHIRYLTHSIPVTSLLPLPLPAIFLPPLITFPFLHILHRLPLFMPSSSLSTSPSLLLILSSSLRSDHWMCFHSLQRSCS